MNTNHNVNFLYSHMHFSSFYDNEENIFYVLYVASNYSFENNDKFSLFTSMKTNANLDK